MTDQNEEASGTASDSPQEPALPATVSIAHLDANNVYWGVETIERTALTPEHVEVPPHCDLEPGSYLWNAVAKRFDPIRRDKRTPRADGVSLEEAVYELTKLISGPLPPRLARWAEQYNNSIGRIGGKG